MRGSAGSVTASKNKSRLYLKRHVIPRNPRTAAQITARDRLATNSRAYVGLTQAQRDAWIEAAKLYVGKRILGEAAKLSGLNAFSRVNNNLLLIGKNTITEPPAPVEFVQIGITSVQLAATTNALTINITPNKAITGQTLVVQATPVLSPGRASLPSALRVIDSFVVAAGGSINIDASYKAKFGVAPQDGQKIQVEVYLIDDVSGLSSLKVSGTFVVSQAT